MRLNEAERGVVCLAKGQPATTCMSNNLHLSLTSPLQKLLDNFRHPSKDARPRPRLRAGEDVR
jgi:hypothetical protein